LFVNIYIVNALSIYGLFSDGQQPTAAAVAINGQ